jgi:hypothetical protein
VRLKNGLMLIAALALITGCSLMHGDPKDPKKNPHPVKRYEVTAIANAPGPWDTVKGYVSFQVANVQCVPQDSFTGARNIPNTDFDFEMTRVGEKTWRGYFYRDFLRDGDYFGQGVCHWDTSSVGASFIVHGLSFTSSDVLDVFLQKGPQTSYFRKSFYGGQPYSFDSVPGFSAISPQVTQHPDAFFPIAVTVKQAMQ